MDSKSLGSASLPLQNFGQGLPLACGFQNLTCLTFCLATHLICTHHHVKFDLWKRLLDCHLWFMGRLFSSHSRVCTERCSLTSVSCGRTMMFEIKQKRLLDPLSGHSALVWLLRKD